MSNILVYKNKTHDIRPYSTNPIYQSPINEKCKWCIGPGRKKVYHSAWQIFKHNSYHHPLENQEDYIQTLVNKIIKGELV